MNAHLKNKEIFDKTGMMLSELPEQYIQDHPQKILATIERRTTSWGDENKACYTVCFDDPEIRVKKRSDKLEATGTLHLHLDVCPANRRLSVLFDSFAKQDVAVWFYGRQFLGNFYVRFFQPKENELLEDSCFQYMIQRTGIPYDIPEEIHWAPKAPDRLDYLAQLHLLFDMFRDEYPEEIRTWIEANRSRKYKVLPFMRTDWRPPMLKLPSMHEAKKFLDSKVYGMEETKKQILQYLEKVRRSGSLTKNLLLVGPPGTGKTTIAQCLAELFDLPMSVIPMGSMLDGETFFGFGETYSGSQEGLFTSAVLTPLRTLPEGGVKEEYQIAQVIFLNELDKVPDTYKSASIYAGLLRTTDANRCFYDVYYQASIPLRNALILADANDLSTISEPLRNRFHIIEIPGYTTEEKEVIFKRFTFPSALKEACVEPSEVAVSTAAISLIAQRCTEPGVREERHVADKIIGDYLMHYAGRKSTVYYKPDMVEPFLPKAAEMRQVNLPARPGSIRSMVCHDGKSVGVQVLADITPAKQQGCHVLGTTNPLLAQEIEAAVLHACAYLPHSYYDVAVQFIGLPEDAGIGELSFAVFMAVLSSFHGMTIPCAFYGAVTLLGGMTSFHCSSPDSVMDYADISGITSVYTATGFSDRLKAPHASKAVELLTADVAAELFFGDPHTRGLQAG